MKNYEEEKIPMLQTGDRISRIHHDQIEMVETNGKENERTLVKVVRSRFTLIYLLLALLGLIILAVLIVGLFLLMEMKKMEGKYTQLANSSNSEKFMRIYEEVMRYRTQPYLTTDNILSRLTPQQITMAKAAGIFPVEEFKKDKLFNNIPPIVNNDSHTIKSEKEEKVASEGTYRPSWYDPTCQIQCTKNDVTTPPLLVISLDGFSREYLDRKLVPSLNLFGHCGSKAQFMYPSYPSKTFPNHYTIATGLYPEAHGIIDNSAYDPKISPVIEDMKRTKFANFYNGEPIWSAAVRQHRRVFCLFWPGCSYNITGYNPTVDIKYNKSMTYSSRVDMIIDWLLLPPNQRPSLIMAYFDQPDSVGHFHTNDQQVNLELGYLESVLNYFFTSLHKNNIFDCTNIVIISDHGMQFLNKRFFFNELVDSSGILFTNGVIGRAYMANSTKNVDWLIDKFKCYDKNKFRIYDRKIMPKRYHYSKTERIGDLIFEGVPGATFYSSVHDDYHVTSDHGYDYLLESMKAVFFARGPNIRPKTILPPFQNIELFNLFTELLRLPQDVPNNGTMGLLDNVINNMNIHRTVLPTNFRPVLECSPIILQHKREIKSCVDSQKCDIITVDINSWLDECKFPIQSQGIFYTNSMDPCFINLCSFTLMLSLSSNFGVSRILQETLTEIELRGFNSEVANEDCWTMDSRYDTIGDCRNRTLAQKRSNKYHWQSLMANPKNGLRDFNQFQFLTYSDFNNKGFTYLQNLTHLYTKKYGRIISFTGTIYDYDLDGLADNIDLFWARQEKTKESNLELLPSHIFRILFRCDDNLWHVNGINCRNSNSTRILAFILPNDERDLNCLDWKDYLMTNTARIKDIELLTNVEFFSEKMWFPEKEVLFWKTNITSSLWEL